MHTLVELAAVFGSAFVAALLQSTIGFGFGIVAVPLLSLAMDVADASVIVAFSSLALNLYLVVTLRSSIVLRPVILPMAAVVAGVPFGLLFLARADRVLLTRVLGALLVAFVIWSFVQRSRDARPLHPAKWGIPLGFSSGALAGAFAMGGPPLVAYATSYALDHRSHVATIQLLLAVSGVVRVAGVLWSGMLPLKEFGLAGAGVAGVALAATLVLALRPRLSRLRLQQLVLVVLSVMAVRYLFLPV